MVLMINIQSSTTQSSLDSGAIDQFITEQMAAQRVPGLALAITQGDQVLYVQGYGTAGAGQTVTPQTQFFLASISKSFTALAVMQLVEAGQIALDAPVQSYLPDFTLADPSAAAQITIRQLLNQTSGLADAGFPEGRLPQPETTAERVSSLRSARPVAAPGAEYHYFNPNYQVLARVVEVVSGQPFSSYLQAHILTPLQMTDSFSAVTSMEARQRADRLAQGYLVVYGLPVAVAEMDGYLAGSGGVISTAQDMANYLIMQNNGGRFADAQLLSPEGMALMHTPPSTLDSPYAMGWIESTTDGTRVLEHNGILSAYYAEMVLLPETGHGIILLYNDSSLASTALAFPEFKHGLIALLTGRQPAPTRFNVSLWSILIGALTLLGAALAVRSLLRLPGWTARTRTVPLWRLFPGITMTFAPALALLAMPALVTATSGRAFSYAQLFRSMPGVFIWLGIGAVLGVINGALRIRFLVRRSNG
jgi:CubicO group peptidase (beta-lactamase class C family)